MKKTNSFKWLWLLLPTFMFASCYDYSDKEDEAVLQLVAITKYDPNASFSDYHTFAISDSIIYIKSNADGTLYGTPTNSPQIMGDISDQMGKNHSEVDRNANPDLGVVAYGFELTNVYTDWYSYYDFYWDWYDWYYPYYPVTYTTSYSTGTLVINVVDLKATPVNGKQPVVWTGIVRGVISGGHTASEIRSAIADCFAQAPGTL